MIKDMKNNHNLGIEVYINSDPTKPVFKRELYLEPNTPIPFLELSSTFRFLFGNDCDIRMSSHIINNM